MGKHYPNHRLVKIHRSYTVEEIARLFDVHKNTVRRWLKDGLTTIDDKRPMLILGHVLVEFIKERRKKNKQPCKPGELYCVRCRVPKFPADNMVEYTPVTKKYGSLMAICPDCHSIMNQRVRLVNIESIYRNIDVAFSKEL